MAQHNVTKILQARLQPSGSEQVVRLTFDSTGGYFKHEFVQRCISQFDKLLNSAAIEPANPLEQLAMQLLCYSAGIKESDDLDAIADKIEKDRIAFIEKNGYQKDVPLHGMRKIYPEHCLIKTNRQCGCGFGQCARGLIY